MLICVPAVQAANVYTSQGANTDCTGTDKGSCTGYGQGFTNAGVLSYCQTWCDGCSGCDSFGISNGSCWLKARTGTQVSDGSTCYFRSSSSSPPSPSPSPPPPPPPTVPVPALPPLGLQSCFGLQHRFFNASSSGGALSGDSAGGGWSAVLGGTATASNGSTGLNLGNWGWADILASPSVSLSGSTGLSVSAWLYPYAGRGGQSCVFSFSDGTGQSYLNVATSTNSISSSTLSATAGSPSGGYGGGGYGSSQLSAQSWSHVAVTLSFQGALITYLNGVVISSQSLGWTSPLLSTGGLQATLGGPTNPFASSFYPVRGALVDVQLYGAALAPGAIAALAGMGPVTSSCSSPAPPPIPPPPPPPSPLPPPPSPSPPQQPPADDDASGREPPAEATPSKRTVSSWPFGHDAGSFDASIGRLTT